MADGRAIGFLDPIDLYTMLGNAIENAIDSAAQVYDQQKRFLSVNIWQKERMAFLKNENYCESIPQIKNGLPVTPKAILQNTDTGYAVFILWFSVTMAR